MAQKSTPEIWWVRRDFRLTDNPALLAAVAAGSAVLPLFVLDPVLLGSGGVARTAWLMAALQQLDTELRVGGGPGLSVVQGRPEVVVPQVAQGCNARQVHIAADFGPYGSRRDARVRTALAAADVELVTTGSPYGVAPGTLMNKSGTPFQVFTPFHRAHLEHGVNQPAATVDPAQVRWVDADDRVRTTDADPDLVAMVEDAMSLRSWQEWLGRAHHGADDYAGSNNIPGADATSHLSKSLRWGHIHPRTVLAGLAQHQTKGAAAHGRQVAWRDFFADVLWHRPDATTHPVRREFTAMVSDDPAQSPSTARKLEAWKQGRTGFPLVDAGMRQMNTEHWMHNRVRLVTASFLVKDLHIQWDVGAAYFMEQLHDGDIAQNQLNWQWVAGCGTDAAPYFRVFNPSGQAEKFDGDGAYIRRYVPELADVPLTYLFEPWTNPQGLPAGYPAPVVDHATERKEALRRYEELKAA